MSNLLFTVDRESFAEAVGWVARSLPSKPVTPVLGGVRIDADARDNRIRLSAYDYEVSAQIDLNIESADAEIGMPGSALVSGRLLAALTRALPRKPVTIHAQGTEVRMACGAAEFSLPTMHLDEYPVLPILPEDTGTVVAADFADAIAQVTVAVSRDDAKPFLCAVNLEVTSADMLTLFATDQHRVVMVQVPWTAAGGNVPVGAQLLVPSRAVAEIARMNGGEIHLAFDGDNSGILGIHAGNRRTTTRLLDHQFPNCRAVFPKEYSSAAVIDVAALAESLNRAILLDDQDYPRVRLEFDGSEALSISGGKAGIGGVREELTVEFYGEPLTIHLNPRYLLEGLSTVGSDKALLMFNDPLKPLGLVPYNGAPLDDSGPFASPHDTYLHVIMPTQGF